MYVGNTTETAFIMSLSCCVYKKKRIKYLKMHLYFWLLQTRKDATQVVANLQRQQVSSKIVASEYLESNKDLLDILISG